MSLQFNKHGDLFVTDQEGATWVPNGNPFDELLHIPLGAEEKSRHFGFPPRHPRWLPDVVDEPSVFDYAPQHESTCGFRFNGPAPGRGRFGPEWWAGDAIGTGEVAEAKIEKALSEVMDLSPRGIREHLNLNRPIYARTSAYGHFGRKPEKDGGFSWERTDLAAKLKSAVR